MSHVVKYGIFVVGSPSDFPWGRTFDTEHEAINHGLEFTNFGFTVRRIFKYVPEPEEIDE